ncbi:Pre-mRNA-processing protein 40B [Capsicum baccatum]|uniref:Pre-mRNA-processing protein 40B n=1 Tax=Capsicum baccatum TaxID=33114 RepID=A0A2G2V9A6_CAPBA|nr:Pre-mRNA-processing protein 40B [Capsicum baccatum]
MMVDNVLVVNEDAVSRDGGIVISTDTVATVADGGGRGGDAGDSSGDGVRRMCGNELVSSGDRPIAFDGGAVGRRGIHGSIWYLDDKSHIKHAVRMAEVITTLYFNLCCASVAIAKYISSPPMSDTNLKVLHKISELSAKALVVLPCYVSLEVESSSLPGKVSCPMIEIVQIKNSSKLASPAVANSEKIGIAVTLENSVVPSVAVVSQMLIGEEYAPNSNEEAKSAFKTLLEYENIGSDCTGNQEDAKALEEQKCNRMEYLEFLKSCDFIKASSQWQKVQDHLETDERCSRLEKIDLLEIFQEYIRDLESEEEEQWKLWVEELRKAEHKNHDEFQKLVEEHVAARIINAKTNWHDYFIKIKDFAAYLAILLNTLGSTAKDLFTDVMNELEKQEMDIKQLQADLATTVRGNDILKYEVQNALDAFSYATPMLKYLELQVLKKDENINQLTNDLQECMKELGVVKAILPKVFQERDFMWEEVKSYSEMNMILNY